MNVAKKFYAKRIKKIKPLTSRVIEEMFSEKKRYFIVKKNLSKDIQYRNLYEVGGGGFSYLNYINNNYKILKVTGIDIYINKKLCKNKSINYLTGDFDGDFPVKNNTVQILIMMMVIEHLFDPFKSFKKVFDLLSDDGIAFIKEKTKGSFKKLHTSCYIYVVPSTSFLSMDGNNTKFQTDKKIKIIKSMAIDDVFEKLKEMKIKFN